MSHKERVKIAVAMPITYDISMCISILPLA